METRAPATQEQGKDPDPPPTPMLDKPESLAWQIEHVLSPGEYGLDEPNRYMYCSIWSPDGAILASGDYLQSLMLWDTSSGELLKNLPATSAVNHCTWSPRGNLIAAAVGTEIWIWDAEEGVPLKRIEGVGGGIEEVAFNPDGTRIATYASLERSGRVWGVLEGDHQYAFPHSRANLANL